MWSVCCSVNLQDEWRAVQQHEEHIIDFGMWIFTRAAALRVTAVSHAFMLLLNYVVLTRRFFRSQSHALLTHFSGAFFWMFGSFST